MRKADQTSISQYSRESGLEKETLGRKFNVNKNKR